MSGMLEDVFLYKVLGKDGFFIFVIGIPVAYGLYQYYYNKSNGPGGSNFFSEPKQGTPYSYGANLSSVAQRHYGGPASSEYMNFYDANNKPANFMKKKEGFEN